MKVGELKKLLETVDDNIEVTIFLPETVYNGSTEDSYRKVDAADYFGKSAIANPSFEIRAGRSFDY